VNLLIFGTEGIMCVPEPVMITQLALDTSVDFIPSFVMTLIAGVDFRMPGFLVLIRKA
jgi:hypothetical protein